MEDRRVEGKGGEGRKAEERKDGKGKEKGKRATQAGAKKQTIIPMQRNDCTKIFLYLL